METVLHCSARDSNPVGGQGGSLFSRTVDSEVRCPWSLVVVTCMKGCAVQMEIVLHCPARDSKFVRVDRVDCCTLESRMESPSSQGKNVLEFTALRRFPSSTGGDLVYAVPRHSELSVFPARVSEQQCCLKIDLSCSAASPSEFAVLQARVSEQQYLMFRSISFRVRCVASSRYGATVLFEDCSLRPHRK